MERLTEKITNKNTKEILAYRVKCHKDLEAIQKLGKLEDLEEQGKLLKPPCAAGDTIYFPYIDSVTKEKVISKEKVTEIGLYYRVGNGELSSCSEIGSIIFVDESEAESALQKMNEMEGK